MIIISKIFNKILLDIEMKFLSGLSFLIISLVCFHFIFYLNFYNFSGDWIEKESSLITIQVMPNKNEKRVPSEIKQKLIIILMKKKEFYQKKFLMILR